MKRKPLAGYVAILWQVMSATGKGYKRHSLRNTGIGEDRRHDKLRELQVTKYDDGKERQTSYFVPFEPTESKIQRRARLKTINIRA